MYLNIFSSVQYNYNEKLNYERKIAKKIHFNEDANGRRTIPMARVQTGTPQNCK